MKNTFGNAITLTLFGESHGEAIGAVLDGIAPGLEVNLDYIDKELEEKMDQVLDIVVLGRNARNASNIKNRQPLKEMFVLSKPLDNFYNEIIEEELNVKKVTYIDDISLYTTYKFKPNFKTLGPKCGKLLGALGKVLAEINGHETMKSLNANGFVNVLVNDTNLMLTKEDLLIETMQTEGYAVASEYDLFVVLDTKLTDELVEEGFVNELVSKVQTMRKDAGFEVVDHITLYVSNNETIKNIVSKNLDNIQGQVLADQVLFDVDDEAAFTKEWNLNGEAVKLAVKR